MTLHKIALKKHNAFEGFGRYLYLGKCLFCALVVSNAETIYKKKKEKKIKSSVHHFSRHKEKQSIQPQEL